MSKSKILYISHTSEIAGAEISLLTLLKNLEKTTFIPLVLLPENGPLLDKLEEISVETKIISLTNLKKRLPLSIISYCITILRLIKIIKEEKIDLIHCNMYISNQYSIVASRLTRKPLICHMRNIINKRCFYYSFLFLTRYLIANSKATEKSYKRYLKKSQNNFIIHNAVSLDVRQPTAFPSNFRQRYGIDENHVLIGCVGQIKKEKGHHYLIEAVGKLIKRYPNIRLFIAGDYKISRQTEYLAQLKKMRDTLRLEGKVIFGGFINDMVSLYSSIDMLVLPSTYEPFGRVLIEAMALKKPVISTFVGGIPEVIENKVSGILVPPEDTDALVDAVEQLIKDKALAERIAKRGQERVKNFFDAKDNTQQIERIYRKLIGEQNYDYKKAN